MVKKIGIQSSFMHGLMVFALLILATVITVIAGVPLMFLLVAIGLPPVPMLAIVLVFGILILGWTFLTFGMRRRK